ncbi:MAG: CotH kinase family protein, partial [Promethearchaeota archaeon]
MGNKFIKIFTIFSIILGIFGISVGFLNLSQPNPINPIFFWSQIPENPVFTLEKPFSSNLPIIIINTYGKSIPDEPKIIANIQIIHNESAGRNFLTNQSINYSIPEFNGTIGIEIRGTSSLIYPKKQFLFETRNKSNPEQEIEVPLLGFPNGTDWILYAPYSDKTLMRNVLAYNLSAQMGHYAVRTKFVELFINNTGEPLEKQYLGVYVFMERIAYSEFRVNITPLLENETMEPAISGGYILKVDNPVSGDEGFYTNRGTRIFYEYPSGNQMEDRINQSLWIKNYMDGFEDALMSINFTDPVEGYAKYIDVDSFVDFIIINELCKNGDGFRASMYMHKDRGGKLKMGPIWDFNLAMGNINGYKLWDEKHWMTVQHPRTFWFERLLEDENFSNRVISRWYELRAGIFSLENITAIIDDYALLLNESKERNFQKWPVLGEYVWPNPPPFLKTYDEEINRLKIWFGARIEWIDENINYIHGISYKPRFQTALLFLIPPFDGKILVLLIMLGMVIFGIISLGIYERQEIAAWFLEVKKTNIRELFRSISKVEKDQNIIIVKRSELKFYINLLEYEYLSNLLLKVLKLDPHSKDKKGYIIRSIYFDDEENKAFYEKIAGVKERKKYRIRMYDNDPN